MRRLMVLAAVPLLFGAAGAAADQGKDESGHGREDRRGRHEERWGDRRDERKHERWGRPGWDGHGWDRRRDGRDREGWPRGGGEGGRAEWGIPPGHLPPPGECRTWYRGVPPGQQPPPHRC